MDTGTEPARPGGTTSVRRGPKAKRGEVASRILAAARASFAANGYAGTTLRAVAADAGVDSALVPYYFSDKAGLLAACLELPDGFAEAVAAAAATPARGRGRALIEAMLSQWEDPAFTETFRSIILTAAHEPVAMERLRQVFAETILAAMSRNLEGDERYLRASLVASQIIGVAMTRYVWRVGALAELSNEEVVRYIAPTIQRYITGAL
jgi:AcrR family transcriptional regulator